MACAARIPVSRRRSTPPTPASRREKIGVMEVLLANPRGFCAGVERAIEIVERALELHGAPIYVRHEIVHNRYVVERLRAKGAEIGRASCRESVDVGGRRSVGKEEYVSE